MYGHQTLKQRAAKCRAVYFRVWLCETVSVCLCQCLRVYVCNVIWTPCIWLIKFYSFCKAAIVGIDCRRGLINEA